MEAIETASAVAAKRRLTLRWLKPAYLLFSAAIAMATAHGTLAATWLQQARAQPQIQADIAIARRVLGNTPTNSPEGLRLELQQAEAQLAAVQETFSDQVLTTPLVARTLELGPAHHVELLGFQARPAKEETLGQNRYRLTPVGLRLQGQPAALLAFLAALEKTDFALTVKTAQLLQGRQGAVLELDLDLYSRLREAQRQNSTPGAAGAKGGGQRR